MRAGLAILLLALLAGCTHAAAPDRAAGEIDTSCRVDADCTVKDVGNCCGYYPACVNVDSPTFPERVKAECAKKGMFGTCGFPVIEGCRCVQGTCTPDEARNRDTVVR